MRGDNADVSVARARFRGDDGAVLAEAALITPIFIFLLFGILEFGGLFRDYLTMNDAAARGIRSAAIAGNSTDADYQIVQAIKKASSAMPSTQIKRIVVYKATSATTPVPAACKAGTASAADSCNVYSYTDFATAASGFGCGTSPPEPDRFWCPSTRKTAAKAAATGPVNGPPDWLGIYIEVEHPWVTGLFGSKVTINTTSVIKLEAQTLT